MGAGKIQGEINGSSDTEHQHPVYIHHPVAERRRQQPGIDQQLVGDPADQSDKAHTDQPALPPVLGIEAQDHPQQLQAGDDQKTIQHQQIGQTRIYPHYHEQDGGNQQDKQILPGQPLIATGIEGQQTKTDRQHQGKQFQALAPDILADLPGEGRIKAEKGDSGKTDQTNGIE